MPTSKCLARFCLEQIPDNLPEAGMAHETEQCRSPRLEQATEVLSNGVQVFNAIKRGKIRTGADTCTASDLENTVAGAERPIEFLPYGRTLGLADPRKRKPLVVAVGNRVERSLSQFCLPGRHAHASFSEIDACKPARA